ncbi:MAG: ABC transporter permease [Omnitrophica WOR_2 bacterium RIFCSPLOWO2_12_FULL_51_24]|nr:MAG: ABC transporter permease [Omnitrophica WOR_2 bacterium RIFCSPLOWO2_02_FULL_50_19]OGX41568.1 MAG: ABC transporter permease [Omnitrophica WOR_2 bacterium RIFCSPLOWO2_12_FULL_51_24]
MNGWITRLGERFLSFIRYAGGITVLLARTVFWVFVPPFKGRHVLEQMVKIGVDSLPIVFLTSLFTGMVLALQSAYQMQKMEAKLYIASLVALSITRELGPVLTALVVAGRIGASIAAELGTMKVTEQIDALETLATNPIKYLVVPRFIALFFMLPLLTIYADIVGIFGGYMIGVWRLNILHNLYWDMTWNPLKVKDIVTGIIKAFAFGIIICTVASYEGMRVKGGAEGVGAATTKAVVIAFILIIAADCLFTAIFYFGFSF